MGDKDFRMTCGWKGCTKAISWKQVFCYPHWKKCPEDQRRAATELIREQRKVELWGIGWWEPTVETE